MEVRLERNVTDNVTDPSCRGYRGYPQF